MTTKGPKSNAPHSGGRRKKMEPEAGRQGTPATIAEGRARPSSGPGTVEEGEVDRSLDPRQQGISNRTGTEEAGRQSKVLPFRRPEQASQTAEQETRQSGNTGSPARKRPAPDSEQPQSPGSRRAASRRPNASNRQAG